MVRAGQLEGDQAADARLRVRFYWIQPTLSAGDNLSFFDPTLYDASKQPAC
jgi:hypothetical protein